MKVMLTLAFEGDRDAFTQAALADLTKLVETGAAKQAAVNVRVEGEELDVLEETVTEHGVRAVVSLWDQESPAAALDIPLPVGSRLLGGYLVDEVVQKDYERTWSSGRQSPGVKLIPFVRRRPDLTLEAYSQHWRERHGPLAVARQPGFWHYVQNHIVDYLTDTTPRWDGIGELHYRTVDDVLTRSFDSEEGMRLIMEDVERFMVADQSTTLPTNEWVVSGS
jgi:EthD domain-containing protein